MIVVAVMSAGPREKPKHERESMNEAFCSPDTFKHDLFKLFSIGNMKYNEVFLSDKSPILILLKSDFMSGEDKTDLMSYNKLMR